MLAEVEIGDELFEVDFDISSGSPGCFYPRYGAPYPPDYPEVTIYLIRNLDTGEEMAENVFDEHEDFLREQCFRVGERA